MQTWTQDQVLSLAPDPSSAKSGRELSSPRKWQNAAHNDEALWGEHQGSGSKPYLTCVDLDEPAFKCTCPSRKFPCKHGLGLLLAFVSDQSAFPAGTPPQWATEWLAARTKKEEQAAKREERKEQEANDPEAKAKAEKAAARTAAQRQARVDKGIQDLDRWLCDMIRAGFSSSNISTYSYWETQAARLVDAQAPGLARLVRNMGDFAVSSGDARRHERLLEEASRIHLILNAYNRLDTLPPLMQDEVRTLVGWTQDQGDLLNAAASLPEAHHVRDEWFVACQSVVEEDKLRSQSTWLWGISQPRAALIMDFAFGNASLDKSLMVGTQVDADLVYFPGAFPLRALVKERFGSPTNPSNLQVWSINDALANYSRALQQNPLLSRFPMFLADVVPIYTHNNGDLILTHIRNGEGDTLPVSPEADKQQALDYLALSGGSPLMMFGIWNGKTFNPLNAWANTLDLDPEAHEPGDDTLTASEAEPTIWDALLTAALLGTERRPPTIPPADGPLGTVLAGIRETTASNPEGSLLAAASTLTIYRQAGKLPAHSGAPLPQPCAPETLAPCNPTAAHFLRGMLNGNNGGALAEWLEHAAANHKYVPHDLLIALMDLGQAQNTYRPNILPVIGNRGRWLAQQFSETSRWDYVRSAAIIETPDEESTLDLWETGSADARFAVLRDMRNSQPARAREMLISVWKQENAKTRNNLLRSLGTNLTLDDEAFLESALEDRSSEVASSAAEYLSFMSNSRLVQRATAISTASLKYNRLKQNKLLGLGQPADKSTIEVTLPSSYTPEMKRDQIAEKPITKNQVKAGNRAWWLLQTLGRTPPSVWTQLWQVTPAEIISAALRTKDWSEMLLQGLLNATQTFQSTEWAEAFLATGFGDTDANAPYKMMSILPQARRNEAITSILNSHPESLYTDRLPLNMLWTLDKPWPADLSRAVLNSVAYHIKNNTPLNVSWQISQSLSAFGFSMPPTSLPEAERILGNVASDTSNIKDAVDDFLTTLKFRQDMISALAQ